jgi:hypothetical protein
MNDNGMPVDGARAARLLLDAVVSQSGDATTDENTRAMTTALSELIGGASAPDAGDVVGASVVCLSWLAGHLALATRRSPEEVVADLREFIDVSAAREGVTGVDRVEE